MIHNMIEPYLSVAEEPEKRSRRKDLAELGRFHVLLAPVEVSPAPDAREHKGHGLPQRHVGGLEALEPLRDVGGLLDVVVDDDGGHSDVCAAKRNADASQFRIPVAKKKQNATRFAEIGRMVLILDLSYGGQLISD